MSTAYHGMMKVKTQPIPFPYAQLIGWLTHIYCFTVRPPASSPPSDYGELQGYS